MSDPMHEIREFLGRLDERSGHMAKDLEEIKETMVGQADLAVVVGRVDRLETNQRWAIRSALAGVAALGTTLLAYVRSKLGIS